jgi:hypothetical protein
MNAMTFPFAKDLAHEPPCSPRMRMGGYVILARTLDVCRADLAGTAGDYRFNCPLDRMLFVFKQVRADDFRARVAAGWTDVEMLDWMKSTGVRRPAAEVHGWSDRVENDLPYGDPVRRQWFKGECERLGLSPLSTTFFDYLDAEDAATFGCLARA